jgi:hydroxypyruvate isomerase
VQVLHNLPAGDWAGGERGIACLPGREGEFRDGVGRAIAYAKALGCQQLNCLVGLTPKGVDLAEVQEVLIGNLRFAADELRRENIRLLVEPVNSRDIPGFHLDRVEKAVALLDAVGSPNAFLQYDFYHQQRSGGELIATYRALRDRIAHVQVADNPGRHEPGTGEIAYDFIFETLDRDGYDGWVGCEYKPQATTSEGLGWARRFLRTLALAQ